MLPIRFIKKSELGKLLAFNGKEYGAGHILTNKKYLDWQFGSFPKQSSFFSILGLFNKRDELLGVLGLNFLDFNFFGRSLTGTSLANLMIKKELRNLGFGAFLLEKAIALNDLAVDHGLNKNSVSLFGSFGWQINDLAKHIFIINPAKSARLTGRKNISFRSSIIKKPIKGDKSKFFFRKTEKSEKALDEFWQKAKPDYPITVQRTSPYLNWRYFNHPFFNYRFFTAKAKAKAKAKAIEGFIVLRIERALNYKVARIVDLVAQGTAQDFLLQKSIEYCKDQKIDFIDYYFSGKFHLSALKRAGFINGQKGKYNYLPTLFSPIARGKKKRINFATKLNGQRLNSKLSRNFNNWYTTKAGGDQDRPNLY